MQQQLRLRISNKLKQEKHEEEQLHWWIGLGIYFLFMVGTTHRQANSKDVIISILYPNTNTRNQNDNDHGPSFYRQLLPNRQRQRVFWGMSKCYEVPWNSWQYSFDLYRKHVKWKSDTFSEILLSSQKNMTNLNCGRHLDKSKELTWKMEPTEVGVKWKHTRVLFDSCAHQL